MDNAYRDIYKLGAREKWWSKDLLSINIYLNKNGLRDYILGLDSFIIKLK